MSNVVQFPAPIRPAYVEIDTGIVTASYIEGENGRKECPEDIGRRRFYVTLYEADGGNICLWSGESYLEAKSEAEEARSDWGLAAPVMDMTQGARH